MDESRRQIEADLRNAENKVHSSYLFILNYVTINYGKGGTSSGVVN